MSVSEFELDSKEPVEWFHVTYLSRISNGISHISRIIVFGKAEAVNSRSVNGLCVHKLNRWGNIMSSLVLMNCKKTIIVAENESSVAIFHYNFRASQVSSGEYLLCAYKMA